MRHARVEVFFALITIGCGAYGLWSAFVALQLWSWFAAPALRISAPLPFLPVYCVFAVVGFFRSARYVKDGIFDWQDAFVSSLLTPGLPLITGFIAHTLTSHV